ncbi:GNAT family N-acetyltransferase [Halosimplex aquaticum]|uniref:GNAT family N-acetyltransferase n=1 Tax=Halosimplex aquaticum TaxID=3026162 RepID=A0ABD5Y616_9EURY|nr:GNAT family N-acetyltransferase [Halosimplex aquaticum]
MPTRVREVTTDEGWDEAVPIIRQLWSDADEEFVRGWRDEEDYRLFGLYERDGDATDAPEPGTLVAVAGVSIQRVLHHERHLWVHDFVVDDPRRGEGFGRELLEWLGEWARDRDCENLALACRDGNDAGRAFYEAEGLEAWGQVMERGL